MNSILSRLLSITCILFASLTLTFMSSTSAFAGVYPFAELKNTISPMTLEILRKHGMAVALDRENPWYAISGVPGNYTIWLHQADEIPQQAVLDIINLCMDMYKQRARKETFRLLIYRESKEQWRKSLLLGIGYFAGVKPFLELTLEGVKQ